MAVSEKKCVQSLHECTAVHRISKTIFGICGILSNTHSFLFSKLYASSFCVSVCYGLLKHWRVKNIE